MTQQVISADSHINEPPWVFDHVPARLKDRAPKMLRGADGGDGWSFDGGTPKRTFGIEATADKIGLGLGIATVAGIAAHAVTTNIRKHAVIQAGKHGTDTQEGGEE